MLDARGAELMGIVEREPGEVDAWIELADLTGRAGTLPEGLRPRHLPTLLGVWRRLPEERRLRHLVLGLLDLELVPETEDRFDSISGMPLEVCEPGTGLRMVWIPEGPYPIGSEPIDLPPSPYVWDDEGPYRDASPAMIAEFRHGFYLGKFPVTQGQYREVVGRSPSFRSGRDRPVETVSLNSALGFCRLLTERADRVGWEYTLPTETRWEAAYRAGRRVDQLPDPIAVGWFLADSRGLTWKVGRKPANPLGLHDMLGNVEEWCADGYAPDYSTNPGDGASLRPLEETGVTRGGAWSDTPRTVPEALRRTRRAGRFGSASTGFRVCRLPPQAPR